jgi:hypothetical protein
MAFAMASCKMLLHNMLWGSFDIHKGPTRGAIGGMATGSLPAVPSGRTGFVARARGIRVNGEPGKFSKTLPAHCKILSEIFEFLRPTGPGSEVVIRG